MIQKLNRDFINTWIIIPWFENPLEFFDDETAQFWAKTIKQEFTYPVDSIVLSSEGTPLAQGEFQELYSPASPLAYLGVLEKAVPEDP